ncbi:hypothetical protein [Xylanimonas sp. McL0601]|uniref:hypothetical protein n=1 Tax=Xylanimonas sp. McL0601 TaxID=3414739 RepID=UPI003CF5D538
MPRLDLDPATFDACSAAAGDAAATLHGTGVLGVPASAAGDPVLASALADLERAWARDVALLEQQLGQLVSALGEAGRIFADAEDGAAAVLAAALGRSPR